MIICSGGKMKTINELVDLLNKTQETDIHLVHEGSDEYKPGNHCWERQEAFEETVNGITTEAQVLFDANCGHMALYVNGAIGSTSSKAITLNGFIAVDKAYYGTEKCLFRQVD